MFQNIYYFFYNIVEIFRNSGFFNNNHFLKRFDKNIFFLYNFDKIFTFKITFLI